MGIYYWMLGKTWAKQGVGKQMWFVPKNKWGFGVVAVAQPQENFAIFAYFYPHLRLQIVFPALNLPQNCYIMAIVSSTQHIYPTWNTIPTIWQNIKAREKTLISQMFSELGKTWKFFQELWKINNSSWAKLGSPNFEYIDDLGNVMP